jgi:hypothetical protein
MGLKTRGVYCIPCECGKVYVGQSGHTIETRVEEHQWHIRQSHPDRSAVAEHSINHDHKIRFQVRQILARSLNIWTDSSGKQQNWVFVQTVSTERTDSY